MKIKFLHFLMPIFLFGCATNKVRTYQEFDTTEKSISMPVGSESLIGDIKHGFIKNGYRVITHTGGVRTTDVNSKEQLSQEEHKARYKLYLEAARSIPLIYMCGEQLQYAIYVIDTKTGTDVLSMTGRDCGNDIAPKFFKALGLDYD